MADTRTVWLVYQECGEYSDYTFTPLSVADDEESAARSAEAFARAWAAKNELQVRGSGAVWYVAHDLDHLVPRSAGGEDVASNLVSRALTPAGCAVRPPVRFRR